jgi:hypothetical protein
MFSAAGLRQMFPVQMKTMRNGPCALLMRRV